MSNLQIRKSTGTHKRASCRSVKKSAHFASNTFWPQIWVWWSSLISLVRESRRFCSTNFIHRRITLRIRGISRLSVRSFCLLRSIYFILSRDRSWGGLFFSILLWDTKLKLTIRFPSSFRSIWRVPASQRCFNPETNSISQNATSGFSTPYNI